MKRTALYVVALLGLLFASSNANASSIPTYTGADINLGSLSVGDEGIISNDSFSLAYLNKVTGLLPANSKITFSYTVTGIALGTLLVDLANYGYKGVDGYYNGSAWASTNGMSPIATGFFNGVASTPLVLASANLTSPNSGTTVITSVAQDIAEFTSMITGLVFGIGKIDGYFIVEAVPLPAALPLLGLGIAGLAGVRARKKAAKAA